MAESLSELHLADLHARAAELGIDGYRLMRRDELIAALEEAPEPAAADQIEAGVAVADEGADTDEIEAVPAVEREPEPEGDEAETEAEPEEVLVEGAVLAAEDEEPVTTDAEGTRPEADEPAVEVRGVLELTRQRFGFVRIHGLQPDPEDVYVSAAQVRRCELRTGDEVVGPARPPRRGERHRALVHVDRVNGVEPLSETHPEFDDLPPELPETRLPLDSDRSDVLCRAVDLLAPLALGQRMLVRAAPRSGRTTLLRGVARAAIDRGVRLVVLLIDERPEEATAWRGAFAGAELAIATADLPARDQMHVAELALERSRRLAEQGEDVVLACDSLSRLALAAGDVDRVKRLFGTGRNLAGGGSVTVVATVIEAAQDDGEAERAVITTESALVTLDADLAAAGVFPAIRADGCRVSNEDRIRDADELVAVRRLRAMLADLDPVEAAALLGEKIDASPSNAELLAAL